MRIALALALVGCTAALPPPVPPRFAGTFEASGGTLGNWQLTPRLGTPIRDTALLLIDPSAPDRALRFTPAEAPPEPKPRGIEEYVASRGVELRIAEFVLDREHCTKLDAIFRIARGHAFGSARFDCNLGAPGRVSGDVEFAAGGVAPNLSGHLEASDSTLEGVAFRPDEAETDPQGVVFWDHRHPRIVFELDPDVLRVISTAERVASFDIPRSACGVLELERTQTGFVRVGAHQHTTWAGTIAIDCATPHGGRLTASLELP
jgi:hypothetical protein